MLQIPLSLAENLTADGFYIVANDKPCQSALELIEDMPVDRSENEIRVRGSSLSSDSVSYFYNMQEGGIFYEQAKPQTAKPAQAQRPVQPEYDSSAYNTETIVSMLNSHLKGVNSFIIGREDIVKQALYAILTGEHMLILSRTGMAKSYLAKAVFNIFEGARVFSSQASKDQTPDNYFGPYNMDEFRKGKIKHNIKGSIIEANFVFLDEFFDASDVVLRSLLSILNERKFINGSEQVDSTVHTAIATANYMRANEVTEAILDRFTYKSIIPEMSNPYEQLKIDHSYEGLRGTLAEPDVRVPFDMLLYLYSIIMNKNREEAIVIPDFIYFMKNVIVNKYISDIRLSDSKFFVSPRKQAKLSDFLRASALLNGRKEVNMDDLKDMYIALCTLNSHVTLKTVDKSEKDIYLDVYQKTVAHFDRTGAMDQLRFLLDVRRLFAQIRDNPARRESLLADRGPFAAFMELLYKLFPAIRSKEDEHITISGLRQNVFDLNPLVEEVQDLKMGLLREYQGLA